MDPSKEMKQHEIAYLMKANIYTPEQQANIVFNQSLQMGVDWTQVCAKQCFKSFSDPLIDQQKNCLNKCGYNVFKSYYKASRKHAQNNNY